MADVMDVSKSTILLVDDNPVSSKVVGLILKKNSDYRTIRVSNGSTCIKKAKEIKPDLILLDIQMPGMNGIEVCKVLKMNEQTCDIPVIFVTANTDDETLEEAFESGGTDYVCKPVNKIELLARVKSSVMDSPTLGTFISTIISASFSFITKTLGVSVQVSGVRNANADT